MRPLKSLNSGMNRRLATLLCFCLLATAGCRSFPVNPPMEKDGVLYGVTQGQFRHRWWNYYERGRSFADGGFNVRAEIDFREAICQNPKDQRRVPTYGRHLTDYFPRRELGIALYFQGRLPQAIQELETSLSMEKSARAEHYLDKARRKWVRQTGSDRRPPEVRLSLPRQGTPTNAITMTVKGSAEDDTYVSAVKINDRPVRMDVSMALFEFAEEIPLVPGENPIRITAEDFAGRVGVWEGAVHCDRTGPAVSVRLSDGRLKGYARDAADIAAVRINGLPVAITRGDGVVIDHPVQGPANLEIEDAAGNRTVAIVSPETTRGFISEASAAEPQPARRLGRYHALIIGIDDYAGGWQPLETPVADARALADLLARDFGFADIRLLVNDAATGRRILSEMRRLAQCLGPSDNLLVYFAGHGHMDALAGEGSWIPVDGEVDDPSRWVTNGAVLAVLGSPRAKMKNLLVIADSCFSGTILRASLNPPPETRTEDPVDGRLLRNASTVGRGGEFTLLSAYRRSRQVITSGGQEPVIDSGKFGHSPFALALLNALKAIQNTGLDAEALHRKWLFDSEWNKGQYSQYSRIDHAGDQEGQFVFFRHAPDRQGKAPPCEIDDVTFPDGHPPELRIDLPEGGHVTYMDRLALSIAAEDENGIQWLSVKGSLDADAVSLLRQPAGRTLKTAHIVALKQPDKSNIVVVRCADHLGNVREKTVVIESRLPGPLTQERRMPLLVSPFKNSGKSKATPDDRFYEKLETLQRFRLGRSGSGAPPAAVNEPPFILNGIILASIASNPLDNRLEITAEIMAPENADKPLKVVDAYDEGKSLLELTEKTAEALALKIVDAFPMVQGEISRVETGMAVIDRGAEDRLFEGLRVLYYSKSDNSGKLREICQGRVVAVKNRNAKTVPGSSDCLSHLMPEMGFVVR